METLTHTENLKLLCRVFSGSVEESRMRQLLDLIRVEMVQGRFTKSQQNHKKS
jgi:hypothetical protein